MTICFLNNSNKGTPLDSLPSLRKGIFIFCSAPVPFRKHPVPQALSGFSLQCHYCNFEVNCSFAFLMVLPQMYVSLNESLFSHLFLNFLVIEKSYAVYILQLAAFYIQHCFSFFFWFFNGHHLFRDCCVSGITTFNLVYDPQVQTIFMLILQMRQLTL